MGVARCADVQLDGQAVEVSAEPLLPVARLEDRDTGFVLKLAPDPAGARRNRGLRLSDLTKIIFI